MSQHVASSQGATFQLDLESDQLLPGRAGQGRVTVTTDSVRAVRGVVAALIATEQWKYHDEERHADGTTHTVTRTSTSEFQRLPVRLSGPTTFAAGQPTSYDLQLPVPPLGPATFEGDVIRLTWELEVKLDAAGLDDAIRVPVVVLQPTALLSAGVVRVGEFGLYEAADVESSSLRGRVSLKPMPLCLAGPFEGLIEFAGSPPSRLQGIRAELRVKSRSTVSGGFDQEDVIWQAALPMGGVSIPITGTLPSRWLPTIELPHGRADATLDVVFDRSMAMDEHLVRDVTLASTREL